MDSLALSRLQEPLSKGENVQKLLLLHVKAYTWQTKEAVNISLLKDLSQEGVFLEWIGMLKGLKRPIFTELAVPNGYFEANFANGGGVVFPSSRTPLYFSIQGLKELEDIKFRRFITARAIGTSFNGTVEEYETFFKNSFSLNVTILKTPHFNLVFFVDNLEDAGANTFEVMKQTPRRTQTEIDFYFAKKEGFRVSFNEQINALSTINNKRLTLYFKGETA